MERVDEDEQAQDMLMSFMEGDIMEVRASRPPTKEETASLGEPSPNGILCLQGCTDVMTLMDEAISLLGDSSSIREDISGGYQALINARKAMGKVYREHIIGIVDFFIDNRHSRLS